MSRPTPPPRAASAARPVARGPLPSPRPPAGGAGPAARGPLPAPRPSAGAAGPVARGPLPSPRPSAGGAGPAIRGARPLAAIRLAGRWPAVVAVAALALLVVLVGGPVGHADAAPGPASARLTAASTTPGLDLLGQSTWVANGGVFTLRLGLTGPAAATDQVLVTAYSRLYTRSGFDAAAAGKLAGEYAIYPGSETLGAAPRAPGGGFEVRIPINAPSTGRDLPTFAAAAGSAVYPLQVQLFHANSTTPVGPPLTTFLVYDDGASAFPRLDLSLTVPVGAAPTLSRALVPTAVAPPAAAALSALTSELAAAPGVKVSLQVTPQTAQALRAGSAPDRATADRLAQLVARGDELLPAPYVSLSLAGLDAAGLDDRLDAELAAGASALHAALGATPDARTWVFTQALDPATLQLLEQQGLRQVVVANSALTALPAALRTYTYAEPTGLADGAGGQGLRVAADDPVLSARATAPGPPVLAAEQTLAELAMIQLEQPSLPRGVAILVPSASSVAPAYLTTLLAGLQRNPFVTAVTASGLFGRTGAGATTATTSAVTDDAGGAGITGGAAASGLGTDTAGGAGSRTGTAGSGSTDGTVAPKSPGVVRSLRAVPIPAVPDAGTIETLTAQAGGVASMYPELGDLLGRMREQLLVAPAADLPAGDRSAILAALAADVRTAESRVRLPGTFSVTLTSLKSTLPMTITSDPKLPAHVQLVLDSPKLGFLDWQPPGGTCTVVQRTTEICGLVLRGAETTLRIPVEARTSGVFTLDVHLLSADGTLPLADARDTVRSTAVSFVGIVIIVLALGFLAIWWIRDIRSGRRARRLVRLPGDDIDDDDGDGGDGGDDPPGGSGDPRPPPPSDPPGVTTPPRVPVGTVPAAPGVADSRPPLAPVGAERRRLRLPTDGGLRRAPAGHADGVRFPTSGGLCRARPGHADGLRLPAGGGRGRLGAPGRRRMSPSERRDGPTVGAAAGPGTEE